jgi:hypothetical protein
MFYLHAWSTCFEGYCTWQYGHLPLQLNWRKPPPLTRLNHCMHTPDCMNMVPVLLTREPCSMHGTAPCTTDTLYTPWCAGATTHTSFRDAQEDTMHSTAPSVCIHSSIQTVHMDMTGTGKQNITSRNSTATLAHPPAHACRREHWTLQHSQTSTVHKTSGPRTNPALTP